MVCLKAQTIESTINLNCCGGISKRAIHPSHLYFPPLLSQVRRTLETSQVDRPQKLEEANSVLRIFGKVLVDHAESRLEHGIKDRSDLRGEDRLKSITSVSLALFPDLKKSATYAKFGDNGSSDVQNLSVPCRRHVPVVVAQNSIEQSGDEVGVNTLNILSFLDVGFDKLENLLLDRSKGTDLGSLGGNLAHRCNVVADDPADSPVQPEHIKPNPAKLRKEEGADRGTS